VLAVKADYQAGKAAIGTAAGRDVPIDEILAALESIGYRGEIVEIESAPQR
jgi:hypothetical protein